MRVISLQGGYNFRDLGGYPTQDGLLTRQGLVFRSGALAALTDIDRATLHRLNIRTVFDLRLESEHETEGQDRVGTGVRVVHLPNSLGKDAIRQQIISDARAFRMVDFYKEYLLRTTAYHAGLFQQVVESLDHGVVIHCSAGKDRTGIMVALLLRVAGVADADIIADYAATTHHLGDYSARQRIRFRGFGMPEFVIDEMLASYPATMRDFLGHLDTSFGSAEAYFLAGGVAPAQIERFRSRFLSA